MIRSLVFLIAACGTLHAQFEGVIESKNTTTDETGAQQQYEMTMWIKDGMAKITSSATGSAPSSTMIYRTDLKVIWMLNVDDKTYYAVGQEETGKEESSPSSDEKAAVKKTRKTKKILGYTCEQYLIVQGELRTEIWGTKRLAGLSAALARALGQEQTAKGSAWSDEMARMGVFPLIASTRIEGKVVESQEIVKIDQRSLPAELFDLPTDYKKQNVGGIAR